MSEVLGIWELSISRTLDPNFVKKVNFINSSQNEGLSPSCITLSFNGFGLIS
jgi:hypothetical protein